MKAVFEELNGDLAVLLIEDLEKTYVLHKDKLPEDAKIGDIFQVYFNYAAELQFARKLVEERLSREESNRLKREKLKRRSQKNLSNRDD